MANSIIVEARLKAPVHPDTPKEILEILYSDLKLPIQIAVKYQDNSPKDVIKVIEI